MTKLALAALASFLLVGCGFVDENIHMSDEELEAEMGGRGFGIGSVGGSGCGIAIDGSGRRHYHKDAPYNIDASHISLRLPPAVRQPKAMGDIERPPVAGVETEPDAPVPAVRPVPRNIDSWGEMIEWEYRKAQRRGAVDDQTVAAVEAMRQ